MARIESLPELCLERVFSFLYTQKDRVAVRLTCRRWRILLSTLCHAVRQPLRRFGGPPSDVGQLPHDVLRALSAFPQATTLALGGLYRRGTASASSPQALFQSTPLLARLTTLNIVNFAFENSHDWARCLTLACPALIHLHLWLVHHATNVPLETTDADLATLASGCPSLTSFSLHSGITDTGIETLLCNSPSLASLRLRSYSLQGWGFRTASNSLTSISINGCDTVMTYGGLAEGLRSAGSTLRDLTLDSIWVMNRENHAPGEDLVALIAQHCSCLEELHLCDVRQVCTVSLQHIHWKPLPTLRSLHVSKCQITSLSEEQGWEALAAAFPKLEVLDARGLVDVPLLQDILTRIHTRWSSLRTLIICDCAEYGIRAYTVASRLTVDVALDLYEGYGDEYDSPTSYLNQSRSYYAKKDKEEDRDEDDKAGNH